MAWLTGWTRRRVKTVENLTISDYQMKLIVHQSGLGPDTSCTTRSYTSTDRI